MSNFNIMIIAHNEAEYVKLCVQSIRIFADVDNLAIIIVDNNSNDGLQEWAAEQTDITYIYNDETDMPYGQIINEVRSILSLMGHLMLLDSHFTLTPSSLSRMLDALNEDESTGAVGPVSNKMLNHQTIDELSVYEEAITWSQKHFHKYNKKVLRLVPEIILIHENTLLQVGDFDTNLHNFAHVIRDYCLRMIQNNLTLKVCTSSLFWNTLDTYTPYYVSTQDQQYLKEKWGMHYFNSAYNENLIKMITDDPLNTINILEIGCDCGATLLEIKNRFPNANIYGSELNEKAVEIASHFATAVVNNIEEYNLPFEPHIFDYIIFGDVLEHLKDPYQTIRYCKTLLKNNGCIIASIPNLMHISVISDLLNGKFTYTETGLLDKTHIHFFTFDEIARMFEACGYHLKHVEPVIFHINEQYKQLIDKLLTLNDTPRFMYESFQYIVCAELNI